MSDVLERINADKRTHIAARKSAISENQLLNEAKSASPPRGFTNALNNAVVAGGYGLIAEIKKASPSKGLIREDFEPLELARAYQRGGATCLSVLTDVPYFQGRDEYLQAARGAVDLPAIRKDFIIDPYQIVESRALGADCVLLIMASLEDALADELYALAGELAMDALIEVHNEEEMERALRLNPRLLGINNRNLKTLDVDLATTERLAPMAVGDITLVCESGLYDHADLERMSKAGTNCFLVGESLMRHDDVEQATRALLGKN